MEWMALSGYRLPQQLNPSNQNELLKNNAGRGPVDNSDAPPPGAAPPGGVASGVASTSGTMLDMWAASKAEAASNSNSSSTLGGPGPPSTPPISVSASERHNSGRGASVAGTSSISTPGSIKGQTLIFAIFVEIHKSLIYTE